MLPSASTAAKTARPVRSGDFVRMAVPSAADVRPCVELGFRFVSVPENTPPATGSGAPARGYPCGSRTVIVPSPPAPFGALAIHGRPLPLLSEMPVGKLADGKPAVTALGL